MRRRALFDYKGWTWVAGALLPLALVGCGPQQAQSTNGPAQRVAGEREEQDVAAVIQSAGLPQTFAYGGRIWNGHQVHYTEPNKISEMPSGDTTSTPGTTGVTNAPGETDNAQDVRNVFDYVALPGLMAEGHQIYRKAGLDEAVTDNIYLRASTGATGAPSGDTNAPVAEGTTGTESAARIAFVEYDAAQTMDNVPLTTILSEAQMPPTVTWGGKTWTAREMQVFDPDVFDEFRPLPQEIGGFKAFQDDDKDRVFLMSNTPVAMKTTGESAAGTTGAVPDANAPGGTTGTPGTDSTAAGAATMSGPVFIRYEAGGAGTGAAGTTNPR